MSIQSKLHQKEDAPAHTITPFLLLLCPAHFVLGLLQPITQPLNLPLKSP